MSSKAVEINQKLQTPRGRSSNQSSARATENGSPFKMVLDYQGRSETLFEGSVSEEHINHILRFADRLAGR